MIHSTHPAEIIVDPPCPLCGSCRRVLRFTAFDRLHRLPGTFGVWLCACGLQSTWPQPADASCYYPDTYYAYGRVGLAPFYGTGWKGILRTIALRYQYGYRYGDLGRRLPGRGLAAAILRLLSRLLRRRGAMIFGPGPLPPAVPGGRALDVGCGNGAWLLKLASLGWQVEGVEFSPTACAAARAAGLDVFYGSLEEAALPTGRFDVVRIWQTLEHLPDPAVTLQEAARLLRPGGRLLVGVPNAGGWLARAWGRRWFDLDVPRHLWHFTGAGLRRLVAGAGLQVESAGYGFYGGYTLLWCLQYWLEERRGYTAERRARFERRWDRVRRGRAAGPIRAALKLLERTNYLELVAVRPQ